MHIAEGVLSLPVLSTGVALSTAGVWYGLKKMDFDKVPKTALLTSAFFVVSLINVPPSVHLTLNGLLGIALGWMVFPAVFVALFLQALFFQYGGFTTLGVNTFIMAAPGLIVYYLFKSLIKSNKVYIVFSSGLFIGIISIGLSTLLFSFSLLNSQEEHMNFVKAVVAAHLPIMIIEGVVSGFCIMFIKKVKPEFFELCNSSSL